MTSPPVSHEGVPPQEHAAPRTPLSYRDAILDALRAADAPLTVPELVERAHCTAVTVRRHLACLRREGAIHRTGRRKRSDGGKPLPSRGCDQYTTL
jgi:hypothetical protein